MTSSARFLADCTRLGGSTDNWRSRAAKAVGGPLLAILLAAFGAATADAAPDRVIGLLSLPEVFGRAPCDRFTPQEVVLYSAPDGRRTGSIRVDRNWTFNPEGGCEGLEVRVHADADGGAAILPTKEFEYEAPAAVVLEQRRTWFRIRTDTGSAWLVATSRDEFFPLRHLLTDRLTYLTGEWDGRLASSAGGTPRPVWRSGTPMDCTTSASSASRTAATTSGSMSRCSAPRRARRTIPEWSRRAGCARTRRQASRWSGSSRAVAEPR